MLVGKQFGPFTIDKELGSGAMGTVYRGRYTKTGQVMAIKIMAPGIGSTNAAAVDRFEREIAILKQLNHPNIVRFYGAGKQQSMRYFAMELIDGESLDKVMSRRGRMTWEEVVELGKQLCSALQHAHEQGIIHRDLKPSNIMVLTDGTLKLTDFGIAKDRDLEGLTATNCTVGTASYMSPEQCKGERNLTSKSDLYSLGVMIYELVTGQKPFQADNAMEMFMEHVNGTFERPSRIVLDIPIWLDTLICQLLEKQPEKRPLDANMVAVALGSIREKVEAQQSAGVDAVRRRLIDRTPGQKRVEEEDKDAARLLMTGKGKTKRKRGKKPIYQKVWFQAIGIGFALCVVVTLLLLAFRGPSADRLYQQAKAVMDSGDFEKQEAAIGPDGVITKCERAFKGQDDERSREVNGWRVHIQMAENERLLDRHRQDARENKGGVFKRQPNLGTEDDAFKAVDGEEKGDREWAVKHWESIKRREGDTSWGLIADKHLAEWNEVNRIDEQFTQMYERILNTGEESPLTDEIRQEAFLAWRMEQSSKTDEKHSSGVGDLGWAKTRFKSLRDRLEKAPGSDRPWYLFAGWHRFKLNEEPSTKKDDLKEKVHKRLETVRDQRKQEKITKIYAKFVCLDVLALYTQDEDMAPVVEEAKKLLEEVSK
ncbi:MAG TPA: serine/threonine-protein kinase [Gemmataceae bacterium]|jgi:serine/threonine-protein kinase